ncbi:MAG: helix-turn-helix domain-containing protein [Oscillospiraceae bacterium]|nr:helix-turn-helix domain-containing protein [Oscillospiraceae bacterium]
MDMVQTGKFIAMLRKEHGLTQEQLGEKIGVTNKTVSRWETGAYLPPADVLLSMSELFDVSVNELLSGRRLTEKEYKKAAEDNLAQAVRASSFSLKDKIAFYKKKWLKEHMAVIILLSLCIIGALAAGVILKSSLLAFAAVVMLILCHCLINNAMMAYAEKNAYDGSGGR